MKFLRNILFSAVFAVLAVNLAFAQTTAERARSAAALQDAAKQLGKQWNGAAIRRSIELFSSAAEEWKSLGEPAKSAEALRESARLNLLIGKYEAAQVDLTRALKSASANDLKSEEAKAQSLLSIVYLRLGKKDLSKKHMEAARRESELSKDTIALAMADFSAAEYFYTWNDFPRAIEHYQKPFDHWRAAGVREGQAEVLIYHAYVYMVLGEPSRGLAKALAAEKIFSETGETRGIKLSQIAIGHLLSAMDERQSALEYYKKAGKDFPDDVDLIEKAALYNGMGLIYEVYGDFEMSLNYRERAFALFEREKYYYGQLSTMHSLINLNYLLKNPAKAEYYFEETKRLSALLNNNYFLAVVYRQIGDFHFEQLSDSVALDYYQKSLKSSQTSGYKENDSLVLDRLGMIHERRGESGKARATYESSLEISRKILNKFSESQTLFNLARLDKAENRDALALARIKQSIEITEHLSAGVLNSKLKSAYFSNVADRYAFYISLLMKLYRETADQNYSVEALRAAEKSRARVMLENLALAEANFTKDADADAVRREKEIRVSLNNKADKLTDLLSRGGGADRAETDRLVSEIRELENELENIKANLKQQSPVYSAIRNPAPFDVADFQQNVLDEDSLLLEFSLGADESYLWIVAKNEIRSVVLPSRAAIETHVEKLRALINERAAKSGESIEDFQKRINDAETAYERETSELSRKLFGQIGGAGFAGKRLIIVPDGKLHYFPVAALPFPGAAANEPILTVNEAIYEPSAQTLAVLAKRARQTAATKNLLIFSDPVFTTDDARFASEKQTGQTKIGAAPVAGRFRFIESLSDLPRLSASKDESEAIIEIIGASHAENYSGFAATRENLLNLDTGAYKILHFATHGLTDEKRPELSGIALSGLDEKGGKLNQLFRIQDIYALDLDAELVVLSACETGVGKEVRGEGLMSLNNAFLQTGARSVVASLWKVEDGATLELMKNFYLAMAEQNLTPSQSLRQAQLKLRENPLYRSPFYWAAFSVQGDFRSAPAIARGGYPMQVYLLPLLPLLLIGIYFNLRRKWRK